MNIPDIENTLKALDFLKSKCINIDTSAPVNYLQSLKTKIENSEEYKAAEAKDEIRMKHDAPKEELERVKRMIEHRKESKEERRLDRETEELSAKKPFRLPTREEIRMKKRQLEALQNRPDADE